MELLNRRPGSPTSKQPLKIFIVSANNATFELSIFGGTSDMALHRAVATRMGVPPAYSDGSESFYVADEDGRVLPLTESLPDGIKLVVKLTEPPPAAPRRQPSASASFIRRPVEQPSGGPLPTPPANAAHKVGRAPLRAAGTTGSVLVCLHQRSVLPAQGG